MIKIKKSNLNPLTIATILGIIPLIVYLILFFKTGVMPVKKIPLLFNIEYYLIFDSILVFIFFFYLLKIKKEIIKIEDEEIRICLILSTIFSLVIGVIMSLLSIKTGILIGILIPLLLGLMVIILGKITDIKLSFFWGISLGTGFGFILFLREPIFVFIPLSCLFFSLIFVIISATETMLINIKINMKNSSLKKEPE